MDIVQELFPSITPHVSFDIGILRINFRIRYSEDRPLNKLDQEPAPLTGGYL